MTRVPAAATPGPEEARDMLVNRALALLLAKRTDAGPMFENQIALMTEALDNAARTLVESLSTTG